MGDDPAVASGEYGSYSQISHITTSGQSSIMPDLLIKIEGANELTTPKRREKTAR